MQFLRRPSAKLNQKKKRKESAVQTSVGDIVDPITQNANERKGRVKLMRNRPTQVSSGSAGTTSYVQSTDALPQSKVQVPSYSDSFNISQSNAVAFGNLSLNKPQRPQRTFSNLNVQQDANGNSSSTNVNTKLHINSPPNPIVPSSSSSFHLNQAHTHNQSTDGDIEFIAALADQEQDNPTFTITNDDGTGIGYQGISPNIFAATDLDTYEFDQFPKNMTSQSPPGQGTIVTGVGKWEEHQDPSTGKIFFFNPAKKLNSWGLPLRDALSKNQHTNDDWECHIDSTTYKRFYRSKRLNRVQWAIPMTYKPALATIPYFSDAYVKECVKLRQGKNTVGNKLGIRGGNDGTGVGTGGGSGKGAGNNHKHTANDLLKMVQLHSVLENPITCAGFHRYLIAKLAEENLLFYGACEVFEKGEWHGQTVLGEKVRASNSGHGNGKNDAEELEEGQQALYKQMRETRASVRMGFSTEFTAGFKSMKDRAEIIYDKFLMPKSELWVCVSDPVCSFIKERIDNASDMTNLFGLFNEAQLEVYDNMVNALYPDFAKAVVEPDQFEVKDFQVDDVLRFAYIDLPRTAAAKKKLQRNLKY